MLKKSLIAAALLCLTAAVYAQTVQFEFINFDDDVYVTAERHVKSGLTGSNIVWAFTTLDAAFYHLLTWLSLMADTNLADAVGEPIGISKAGWFHFTNAIIHAANVLLLFGVLVRLTGATWKSALVAALFAVHPLHVESVAWVTERKDVLSTFFGLQALLAYGSYARKGRWTDYLFALIAFTCSLLAKSMFVTLPFLLLVLDYWPLRRPAANPETLQPSNTAEQKTAGKSWLQLLNEKIPFFLLTLLFCVLSIVAQGKRGAVAPTELLPISLRAANAATVYVIYIRKMFWPVDLAVYYPHPNRSLAMSDVVFAVCFLILISILAFRARRFVPAVLAGWLWYLGTLVPVIGLVQLWDFQMADRFTYFPSVGLSIAFIWGVEFTAHRQRRLLLPIAMAVLACLTIAGQMQARTWENSVTVFRHAMHVTRPNQMPYSSLASELEKSSESAPEERKKRMWSEGLRLLEKAMELAPHYALLYRDRGLFLQKQKKIPEAIKAFEKSVQLAPEESVAYFDLGNVYGELNDFPRAISYFRLAIQKKPRHAEAHHNLGFAYLLLGEFRPAISHLQRAIDLGLSNATAYANLGNAYRDMGDSITAEHCYRIALQHEPNQPYVIFNWGLLELSKGSEREARRRFETALQIDPNYEPAQTMLKELDKR